MPIFGAVAGFIVKNALALTLFAATTTYTLLNAARQRKKLRRAQRERATFGIRQTPGGGPVQIAVGDTAIYAEPVDWFQASSAATAADALMDAEYPEGPIHQDDNNDVRGMNNRTFGALIRPADTRTRQYLGVLYVVSGLEFDNPDGIVSEVWVNEKDISTNTGFVYNKKAASIKGHAMVEFGQTGTVMASARVFNPDWADAKFKDLFWCFGLFKQEEKNPQLATEQLPEVLPFLTNAGRWKSIGSSGFGADTRSNDLATVIAGCASHPRFGPGLAEADIDFDSFSAAQAICAVEVPRGESTDMRNVPEQVLTYEGIPFTPGVPRTYTSIFGLPGYSASRYPVNSAHRTATLARPIKRYEVNGIIDTSLPFPELVEELTEVAPGAFVFPRLNGKLGIKVPDETVSAATASVMTVREEHLVGPIQVTKSKGAHNAVSMRYSASSADYALETKAWPRDGSPAETTFLAEDDEKLIEDYTFDYINNEWAAYTAGGTSVLLSRREAFTLSMRQIGILLELGDVLEIDTDAVSAYVMVVNLKQTPEGFVDVGCILYVPSDFAWRPTDSADVTLAPGDLQPVPAVTNLTLAIDEMSRTATATFAMAASQTLDVTGFWVEVSRDGKTTWHPHRMLPPDARDFSEVLSRVQNMVAYRITTFSGRRTSDTAETMSLTLNPILVPLPGPGTPFYVATGDVTDTQALVDGTGDIFLGSSATVSTKGAVNNTTRIVLYSADDAAGRFVANRLSSGGWGYVSLAWGITSALAHPAYYWALFSITSVNYDDTDNHLEIFVSHQASAHEPMPAIADDQLIGVRALSSEAALPEKPAGESEEKRYVLKIDADTGEASWDEGADTAETLTLDQYNALTDKPDGQVYYISD